MRDAGLPVAVTVEGEPYEVSPGLDMSAYRIVQEALTNVLRHAGPRARRRCGRSTATLVEVEVVDDRARRGPTAPATG